MDISALSAGSREALAAGGAAFAVLVALTGAGAERAGSSGGDRTHPLRDDPLRDLVDGSPDGPALAAGLEAPVAALKVRLAADYVQAAESLASPAASAHDATCQELAVTAEVARVLTVSERAAGAFVSDCQALTTVLPLTLAALIPSWTTSFCITPDRLC